MSDILWIILVVLVCVFSYKGWVTYLKYKRGDSLDEPKQQQPTKIDTTSKPEAKPIEEIK